jgi:hypothetical protein
MKSPVGTFRTYRGSLMISAPGGKTDLADMTADFREWSLADLPLFVSDVRFQVLSRPIPLAVMILTLCCKNGGADSSRRGKLVAAVPDFFAAGRRDSASLAPGFGTRARECLPILWARGNCKSAMNSSQSNKTAGQAFVAVEGTRLVSVSYEP